MTARPVINDATKRRWRRGIRKGRRGAVELSQQADQQIEKLLLRRFDRLLSVRRFVFLWTMLFVTLILWTFFQSRSLSAYYQSLQPVPGGIYSEGIAGTFTNANPLYASSAPDRAASRLVFAGLLKYDNGNNLVGDLAQDWVLGPAQTHYTVHLNKNLTWHDGQPLTAADVVFTFNTIKNIEAQSSLYNAWEDITVVASDAYTITFDLPTPLASFPHSLTIGIIPAHLLKNIPVAGLRSAPFNSAPVGAGPFIWKFVEVLGSPTTNRQQRITMAAFNKYEGGRPKLDGFNLITYSDEKLLVSAFKKKQINAMSGLESVPGELAKDKSLQLYITPLTSAIMAFFNTSRGALSDINVRRALTAGVERQPLVNITGHPTQLVDSPLLRDQLGYNPELTQRGYDFDQANQLLDQAGWVRGDKNLRYKNGQVLEFTLRSQDTQQYSLTTQYLQQQWEKIGVKINATYYSGDDLQGQIIASHDYDILVYGISIGADPDVFAYWDSSQASTSSQGHSNLSEYKSATADEALEAGRSRTDNAVRVVKYKAFLTAWTADVPALTLYQPNYIYITRGQVFGYNRKADNSVADRFYNVENWMVRQKRQTN
ncbi:MAG: peptide ABC transporter substrate-binding protein [bacterium]|nr:peptide ABC transporter substrate-binding protein [bacterium]